jgi:predicted amidohydrolase
MVLVKKAAAQGANLAVTIEALNHSMVMGDPRYDFYDACEPLDGPNMALCARTARECGIHLIAGLYLQQDGLARNAAVLWNPAGQIAGIYHKVHLPLGEGEYVAAGNSYPVFETDLGPLGMLVCWDNQYPEAARALALNGAKLIAVPTWGC